MSQMNLSPQRQRSTAVMRGVAMLLVLATLMLWAVAVSFGSQGFEPLWGRGHAQAVDTAHQIVWEIRLPRALGAWLAGALLGLAGAVAQGLFRNPLAEPYLLGSASGASLGVAMALWGWGISPLSLLWVQRLGLTGAAFLGSLMAVALTMMLSRGVANGLRLLLAGVVVGVVLGAVQALIVLLNPEIMQAMQAFMLGSTSFVGWSACAVMAVAWVGSLALAVACAAALDALALGEATARSLGLPINTLWFILIGVLAMATGAAVAQTGLIAFVGLAAPHAVRALVRTRHRELLLLSSLMGGVLLLAADVLARTVWAPQELPVGVVTAVSGGLYLLWLMHLNAQQKTHGGAA